MHRAIGCFVAHRFLGCDVDIDLDGRSVSRQGRLSIVAARVAGRARATRLHDAHLDAARHLERLSRRGLPANGHAAERLHRRADRALACADTERFWNLGLGGRWVPQRTLDAHAGLRTRTLLRRHRHHSGRVDPGLSAVRGPSSTPARLGVAYQWTTALQVRFHYTREQYNSNDWALNGVGPSTVPNLLSLGIQPYRDNVNLFALTVRYQFGHDSTPHAPQ